MFQTKDMGEFYRKNKEAMICMIMRKGIDDRDLSTEILHKWVIQALKYNVLGKFDPARGVKYETYISTTLYNSMAQYRKKTHPTVGLQFVALAEKDYTKFRMVLSDLISFKGTLKDEENQLLDLLLQGYTCDEISQLEQSTPQWVSIRRKRLYRKWKRFSNR